MASNLVIAESPVKVKTIKELLGSNYVVDASQGHVRDFPKSQLGIDVEHGYEPKHIIIHGEEDVLTKLRKEVKKTDKIYLVTDPNREREAISWHLQKALKLEETRKKVYRITFNEIIRDVAHESIKHPGEIDMDLVDAQQTCHILDRVVGYSMSPLFWAKVKRGLSAGKVQSVALRMMRDREAEIGVFVPKEYWSLGVIAHAADGKKPLEVRYYGIGKEKMEFHSRVECFSVTRDYEGKLLPVREVKKSERSRKVPLPFTTSALQQEVSKCPNFSTQKIMRIARQFHESIKAGGRGTIALTTYLRTDNTRVTEEADTAARVYIRENYGETYIAVERKEKQDGQKIQNAHETIRPTNIMLTPATVRASLSRDQFRLHQLIWERFTAGYVQKVVYASTSAELVCGEHRFSLSGSPLKFSGFMEIYSNSEGEEGEKPNAVLLELNEGEELVLEGFDRERHFMQPPAHYAEASLVRVVEERDIDRPSTYTLTITTILARRYVIREQKNFYVMKLGQVVNRMMVRSFPVIVEPQFTANLERLLNSVGESKMNWKTVVESFYPGLSAAVKQAERELESVKTVDEESDVDCELCDRCMVIKYGPHGKFLACPGFPECRNTKPYLEKIRVKCPKCGGELVHKRTKGGRIYYGRENNPTHEFIGWIRPSEKRYPKCGGYIAERGDKLVCADKACGCSEVLGREGKG